MSCSGPQSNAAVPRFDRIDLLGGVSILTVILLHVALFLTFNRAPCVHLRAWLFSQLFLRGGNGVTAEPADRALRGAPAPSPTEHPAVL